MERTTWYNNITLTHHFRERYYERVLKMELPYQYIRRYVDMIIIKDIENNYSIRVLKKMVNLPNQKMVYIAFSEKLYMVIKNRSFITIRPN